MRRGNEIPFAHAVNITNFSPLAKMRLYPKCVTPKSAALRAGERVILREPSSPDADVTANKLRAIGKIAMPNKALSERR